MPSPCPPSLPPPSPRLLSCLFRGTRGRGGYTCPRSAPAFSSLAVSRSPEHLLHLPGFALTGGGYTPTRAYPPQGSSQQKFSGKADPPRRVAWRLRDAGHPMAIYIYMYIYVCVYIYIYIYPSIHISIYLSLPLYLYLSLSIYIYTYLI